MDVDESQGGTFGIVANPVARNGWGDRLSVIDERIEVQGQVHASLHPVRNDDTSMRNVY